MLDPLAHLILSSPYTPMILLPLAGIAVAVVVGTLLAGFVAWVGWLVTHDVGEIVRELRKR